MTRNQPDELVRRHRLRAAAMREMLKGFLVVVLWALYLGFVSLCVGAYMRFKWRVLGPTHEEWDWSYLIWAMVGISAIVIVHLAIAKIADRVDAQRGLGQSRVVKASKPDDAEKANGFW